MPRHLGVAEHPPRGVGPSSPEFLGSAGKKQATTGVSRWSPELLFEAVLIVSHSDEEAASKSSAMSRPAR